MKKIGAIVFLLILAVIFTGCVERFGIQRNFEINNLEIEPKEINPGESVNIEITIKNKGKEMTPENKFKVGVKVTPPSGNEYWNITEPELIKKLNPKGLEHFEFHAESKPGTPPGDSTFQVYISSSDTGKEFHRKEKKVYVRSPEEETPAFESIFAIAALIVVAYLIKRKRE